MGKQGANYGVWDSSKCSLDINRTFITGLGEDAVSWEQDEDEVSYSVGAFGDVQANEIASPIGTITIGIQETSPQYSFIMKLLASRKEFSIWVNTPREKVGGTKARFLKKPGGSIKKEAEGVELEVKVADYTYIPK